MIYSFLLFIASLLPVKAAVYRVEVVDLSAQLKVFENERYIFADSTESEPKSLFLFIEASRFKGNFLELEANKNFAVFINGTLVNNFSAGVKTWSLDSLARIHSPSLSFTFYRENPTTPISAKIISFNSVQPV